MPNYRRRLHDVLSPREHRLLARLDTPQKIQTFLDRLPVNFSLDGDTAMSPRRVLEARMPMKTTFPPGHYRRRVAGVLACRLLTRLFES